MKKKTAIRRKRGRPEIPPDQRRSEDLRVLLTPPEREDIDKAAAEAGQTPGAWARERLVRAARRATR